MKAFIFASFLAVAAAIPLEDTAEVLAAKAVFNAAFAAAEAGDHAALAPVQGAATYMAVLPEVAEATAAHAAVFDAYTAGTVALPVAPVFTGVQPAHVVAPVPNVYLADLPEVTEAKVAFKKVFDAYKAGEIPLPVAPVHEVKPVVATPAVAPVAIAAYPYAHHYGAYGAHPAYAHAAYAGAYAGYPYAGAYGAYGGYGGYGAFGGYPYALPVAAAKAE